MSRSLLEPIAPWRAWSRKLAVFGRVGSARGGRLSVTELYRRMTELSKEVDDGGLVGAVEALWRIEQLAFRHCVASDQPWSWSGDSVPLVAGPPAHCALSMAAVFDLGFDGAALRRLLQERADPRFVFFSYESLGAMLAIAEPDLFGRLVVSLGRLRLLRYKALSPVDHGAFLASFDDGQQRLIAHGYGRLTYFKSHSFRRTVERIRSASLVPFDGAVRGAVAALGLVNCRDLGRIARLVDEEAPEDLSLAIGQGFRNLVLLLEWSHPGALQGIELTPRAAAIAEEATAVAHAARRDGQGPQLVA